MASAELWVEALGSRVAITADEGGPLASQLRQIWGGCSTEPGPAVATISVEGANAAQGDAVLEWTTQRVTLAAIEAAAGRLLMLHACAVAEPTTGRSVILVGPSGMGKTTLAATLGRRWGYVTDEAVGLTDDLRLLPYPKPLSMVTPGKRVKRQVAPETIGLRPWRHESKPVAVFLLDRRTGQEASKVKRIPTVPAVALLAQHVSYLARLDRPLARLASLLHGVDGLREVSYSSADQLLPVLAELLEGR